SFTGTEAGAGTSSEQRDCQRNISVSPATTWEGRRNRRDGHTGSPHCRLRTTWPEEPQIP
ncbi:MAG TPA: hypothetical protein VM715_05280, partial [Candidatus Acidoferrum sp.]|nr:hypothetical protein [Candidatus Acidoferrum sp.]